MRLLLIEDEAKVAAFIRKGMEMEGYMLDVATDGPTGLKMAFKPLYDCIILDLMLPGIGGLQILEQVRREGIKTAIIILTSLGNLDDRIAGLNKGADDYLVKPFAFGELLARVKALIRRSHKDENPVLEFNGLSINTLTREVFLEGDRLDLTPREYSLLEFFAYNADRALSRLTLSEHVWEYHFDRGTNYIDVFISRLRQKIEPSSHPKYIHTVRGYGYIFKPQKSKE